MFIQLLKILPFVVLVGVAIALGRVFAERETPPIEQPIQFDHSIHTDEWELDCDTCHRYVYEADYAGRPKTEICAVCHEDPQGESAEEAKVVEYIARGEEIPWRRLYDVPDHVFYSHRIHVTVAQIECAECHGDIGHLDSPPGAPLKDLTMEFCIACHETEDVTTDCNDCHK